MSGISPARKARVRWRVSAAGLKRDWSGEFWGVEGANQVGGGKAGL